MGTSAFALSGALRAVDRRPDFVGMLILAGATAIGGSVLRDVLLNRDVVMLRSSGHSLVILLSVVAVFCYPAIIRRRECVIRYFDAVGLGVFSAFTASVAWSTPGVSPLSVLYLAAVSGCAGGTVRDVVIQKPSLVLSNEVYVTPMIVGTAALMVIRALGGPELAGFITAMSVTTGLRLMAIYWDWRLPRVLSWDADQAAGAGEHGVTARAPVSNATLHQEPPPVAAGLRAGRSCHKASKP